MAAPRRWLITGVSSGLGRAIAEAALAAGDHVAGTLRKRDQFASFEALAPGRAHAIALDVTEDDAPAVAVEEAVARLGGVDVLVNNAGYALVGPVEDISLVEARQEMETNFFGVLKMCQAVLPHFHARGGGRIINVASVAAVIGFPMNGLYGASKMAVYGLTETLAKELSPYGVKVTSIEPGGFRTNFALGSMAFPEKVSPHNRIAVEATQARMADFARIAQNDPAKGAQAVLALAAMDKPPVHLSLGEDALAMITGALKGRIEEYERFRDIGAKTAFGG